MEWNKMLQKITFINVWHSVFKVNNRRQDKYAIVPAQEIMLIKNISKETKQLLSKGKRATV